MENLFNLIVHAIHHNSTNNRLNEYTVCTKVYETARNITLSKDDCDLIDIIIDYERQVVTIITNRDFEHPINDQVLTLITNEFGTYQIKSVLD